MANNDPHGPNRQSHYFGIHDKAMRDLAAHGFVLSDDLTISPYGHGFLIMQGTIQCLGEIEVSVEKILEQTAQRTGEPTLQTTAYSYNARLRGRGNILRYDSPHETHNPFHHVHRYDVFAGDQDGTVEESTWPTLGQVLSELEKWYYEHYETLTNPNQRPGR